MAGGRVDSYPTAFAHLLDVDSGNGDWMRLPDMIKQRDDLLCQPVKEGKEVVAVRGLILTSVEV